MESLIQSLNKVNQSLPFTLPKGFQSHPKNLKEMIRIMNLPNPDFSTLQNRMVHDFTEENAQGIAFAHSNIWFLSSEKKIFKYRIEGNDLYNPNSLTRLQTRSLSQIINDFNGLATSEFDHIGDLHFHNGLLFVPIRSTSKDSQGNLTNGHLLVALNDNFQAVAYARFDSRTNDAWCAINPWNQYLYTSPNNSSNKLYAYQVSAFYDAFNNPNSWGNAVNIGIDANKQFNFYDPSGNSEQVRSIQGAVFSPNGRLYIARYNGSGPWDNFLYVYNALTGRRMDYREYDFAGIGDEIEGLDIHPSGIIYIVIADNDLWPSTDEFEIYAFKYSDSSFPV